MTKQLRDETKKTLTTLINKGLTLGGVSSQTSSVLMVVHTLLCENEALTNKAYIPTNDIFTNLWGR